MLSNIISVNDGLYKIAVGKYDRNLTNIDNDFTQIVNVSLIVQSLQIFSMICET